MHSLSLISYIEQHLGWFLFGLIVLAGIVVGLGDMMRLSRRRLGAIAGVCFVEAWRRRVFLIAPLAFFGVIVIAQLQRPIDEQDAIRQTVKFALFATGLVVTVTTIILACTNLPKEIDNRVIYSIATKPTTRLEIVLGKIAGFALVSMMILLFMGALTWGYLSLRAWGMQRDIAQRLDGGEVSAASVPTLQYYRAEGLLNARKVETPDDLQIYARLPEQTGTRRYFAGGGEGSFMVPFRVTGEMLTPPGGTDSGQNGLIVVARVAYERDEDSALARLRQASTAPTTAPADGSTPAATLAPVAPAPPPPGPELVEMLAPRGAAGAAGSATQPTTAPAADEFQVPFIMSPEERARVMSGGDAPKRSPVVSIEVLDNYENQVGVATPFGGARDLTLDGPEGATHTVAAFIDPGTARKLSGLIYIRVTGMSGGYEYFVETAAVEGSPPAAAVSLAVPAMPADKWTPDQPVVPLEPAPDPLAGGQPTVGIFQTRGGTFGQQLRGGNLGRVPIAIYRFRGADFRGGAGGGFAPFELRAGIERSTPDEIKIDSAQPTEVALRIRNARSGQTTEPMIIRPESRRTLFFRVPASAEITGDGNFDVLMTTLTPGDFLGLDARTLVLITDRQPFAWNLAKSLLILWLMSVLVTAVSIFTSTFLSWPIAVVLTLVILLGHWGVQQLGESTAPGVGAQVVTDFGLKNPAKAEAVRATVERLSSFLNFISTILPDISQFAAVEDIERGVAISPVKVVRAAAVALGFGLPLALLAYVFLKHKEVAP